MTTIVLQVSGMKCGGCENTVKTAVQACPGVTDVKPSHKTSTVEIDYDPSQADLDAIRNTIKAKGFTVA